MRDERRVMGRSLGAARILLTAALLAGGAVLAPPLAAARTLHEFRIDAGPLDAALSRYSDITGRQLLYASNLVVGLKAPLLDGRYSADTALARLLAGSNIKATRVRVNVFVLEAKGRVVVPRRSTEHRVIPVAPGAPSSSMLVGTPPATASDFETPEIVVTGTNIRGNDAGASPLITIDEQAIERSGYGSIAEVIAALPQNFGGAGGEDVSLTGVDRGILNSGLGSAANLRGLGADATLTLVNGRRVAGSGGKGDFTDLSTIPIAAIERVEVLTDGASALYGSDAVGGVVNIILKRRLDGAVSRARIGSVTRGGSQDYQLGQLVGARWASGHVLAAYEFQRRERLKSSARRFAASADLRPLGGDDFRSFFASPGTILGFDPVTGALVPAFAIPAGQDGQDLDVDDLVPGANLENPRHATDILPQQTRHSTFLTAEQNVADIRLFAEARYAHRRFAFASPASLAFIVATPANPFFISPDGQPFSLIAYSLGAEIGPIDTSGAVEAWSGTAGAAIDVGNDWQIEAFAAHAKERTWNRSGNIVNTTLLDEALGNLPDDPETPFSTALDGFFNPYGDGNANARAILDFVAQGFQSERLESTLTSANVKADGTLADLAGGPIKLALGGQYRREAFARTAQSFFSGTSPRVGAPTDGRRTIAALYGELAVPLVGSGTARPGLNRLSLSLALRHERYSDFGATTNPKLGIVWSPLAGLDLKASYGTSFRAPALRETRDPVQIVFTQLAGPGGGAVPVLFQGGGNPDLLPERANTFTIGASIAPKSVPGLNVDLGYFDIRFADRIGQPVFEQIGEALIDPSLAPFVRFVDPANNAADRAFVEALLAHPGSVVPPTLPPELFRAVIDARYVNTAKVIVRGVDITASYAFTVLGGNASASLNASYLIDSKSRTTPLARFVERVDIIGNPADLRLRGSATWSKGPFALTATGTYVGSYLDDLSVPKRKIDAWTTFDLQLRYQFTPLRTGRDAPSVSVNAQNLFASDPPFANSSAGIGYDAANADPLGRFVALQLNVPW